MCELFGFSSAKKTDITECLEIFFSHSDMHPHGFGIMYEKNGTHILRQPKKANESKLLWETLDCLPPQKLTLAHIRYATVGKVREENCHPFTGRDITGRQWTMIHNGTIYSGKTTYRYFKTQRGDTDSERLFMALLDKVNERASRGKFCAKERFSLICDFVAENSPRNKLNLMIWDEEYLYVHKNLKNTLCFKRTEAGVVISTRPLDDSQWVPFPTAQVIAYKEGKEVFKGKNFFRLFARYWKASKMCITSTLNLRRLRLWNAL